MKRDSKSRKKTRALSKSKSKLNKNRFIFAIVIGVLALLGLHLLLDKNSNTNNMQSSTSTPAYSSPTSISTPTPYVNAPPIDSTTKPGWKIYTSGYAKMSFDFPSTWKFEVMKNISSSEFETVRLISPEGLTIDFNPNVSGLGGGCDPSNCPNVKTLKVTPIENTNSNNNLFLVEGSYNTVKRFGVMSSGTLKGYGSVPQVGETKTFPYYMLFLSSKGEDTSFIFDESVASSVSDLSRNFYTKSEKMTDQQFFNLPVVQTAEEILSSLKF